MSNTVLIVLVAAMTFASRALFMLRPVETERIKASPFLQTFPVALFATIATVGLAAPGGVIEIGPSLAAGLGGLIGALLFRKSILAVVILGLAAYWLSRVLYLG